MEKLVLLVLVAVLSGCTSVASQNRPSSYYENAEQSTEESNLFGGSDVELSDKDISKILNYQLRLRSENRIAVLRMAEKSHWRYYSQDFNEITQSIADNFIGQLRSSRRVYDASFLPSMLVPEKRTVPFLREAAARFQADLLLVYRSSCQTFEKYRLINASESRAFCSVEAVLLDTRSGIIPFTMVATNEFSTERASGDKNFSETIKKAELEAISESLSEIASEVVGFLGNVETL